MTSEADVCPHERRLRALKCELSELVYMTTAQSAAIAELTPKAEKYDALLERRRARKKRQRVDEVVAQPGTYDANALLKVFGSLATLADVARCADVAKREPQFLANLKFCRLVKVAAAAAELDALIGMNCVKKRMFSIICFHATVRDPQVRKDALQHMVLQGPPGVGKTMVAGLIAKIFFALGVLPSTRFVVATRADLVSSCVGGTALKTRAAFDSALGGVLFIDEAYSLGCDVTSNSSSFSPECINCINERLSALQGRLLCIVAGYQQELDEGFFATNKGLDSRFPQSNRLVIEGYSTSELTDMLLLKAAPWAVAATRTEISHLIKKHQQAMTGYGRDIECLLRDSQVNAISRAMRENVECVDTNTITLGDIELACTNLFAPGHKTSSVMDHIYL